ncbi:MAG: hypothetical protein DRP00_02705 [Candidatus Aenigmatarchaeota archaeon]|nr:MAG: hypothetical protein DRP00_02705 [Candidatus Aenigmarchaeota archaeon]
MKGLRSLRSSKDLLATIGLVVSLFFLLYLPIYFGKIPYKPKKEPTPLIQVPEAKYIKEGIYAIYHTGVYVPLKNDTHKIDSESISIRKILSKKGETSVIANYAIYENGSIRFSKNSTLHHGFGFWLDKGYFDENLTYHPIRNFTGEEKKEWIIKTLFGTMGESWKFRLLRIKNITFNGIERPCWYLEEFSGHYGKGVFYFDIGTGILLLHASGFRGVGSTTELLSTNLDLTENTLPSSEYLESLRKIEPELFEFRLPRYEIVETSCKPNSNEVKIWVKANEKISSGVANLTLAYLNCRRWGKIYLTSLHAYNGSHSVFIDPENENPGEEKDYIYKAINFGDNGRIKWRWMVDENAKELCNFRYLTYWIDNVPNYAIDFCEIEKGKWYEYSLNLKGNHTIGIGVFSWLEGNNDWDAAIDYIEVEKNGTRTVYDFENGTLEGWNRYNSYECKTEWLKASLPFEGCEKNEVEILNFSIPQPLRAKKYYLMHLYVNGIKQRSYCITYNFTEIVE